MRTKETFILSLWVKEGETTALQGLIQNVKSGEKQPFANAEQLLELLRTRLQPIRAISSESKTKGKQDE